MATPAEIDLAPTLNDVPSPIDSAGSFDEKHDIDKEGAAPDGKSDGSNDVVQEKVGPVTAEINDSDAPEALSFDKEHIIRDGNDVAQHLLPDRDDGDPSITFRGVVLGAIAAAFQATMNQLYLFKPTQATITGSFLVLIIYFLGKAWALLLPTEITLRARWGEQPRSRTKRVLIRVAHFINPGPFGLKEHAVASITATSASNGSAALIPFTVQRLYYPDVPVTAGNVIMSTLSIGLFGYGLTGLFRPLTVYPSLMVYWSNIPLVQMFQRLHWESVTQSKPLRWFWYAFAFMTVYEFFPAYIFPTLVAFSIPCLASMHAPASRQELLTNLFGGAQSNEGLGLFSICFDWQYIQSFQTSLPLIQQANSWVGLVLCYILFAALYYGNAFGARDLPFLSTSLLTQEGKRYPSTKVFVNGVLNEQALKEHGLPRLTATNTLAMIVGNAAIGALIAHCILFWAPLVRNSLREARTKTYSDRHQRAMQRYPEVSWLWFVALLVVTFVLGLVANITEHTTLPWWAYIVALIVGTVIAPFSTLLYAMFGNGIATNQLMKMIAGVLVPGRPLANMYFSAWSHTALSQMLNLSGDLKLGSYLKIPPRVMFLTQIWGIVLGSFINYVVMVSVVNNQHDLLLTNNGSGAWSGQYFQSTNTQATVWALSKYLYTVGAPYVIVPLGLVIGFGAGVIHFIVASYVPKIGKLHLKDISLPVIFLYSGWFGFNQTQSCIMFTTVALGVYVQFYLRNYKPLIFKKYSYIIAAAFDGGSLLVIFILSFAVFGAAGTPRPFPTWAGNPDGFPDHCPDPSSS